MSPISAAILAGGKSSRMGRDKAMLEVGGQHVISRVIEAVRHVASDVMVIGERPELDRPGVRVVPDEVPGLGPLGGIATALRHAQHEFVLVVGCDMPLLSSELLIAMAREERTYQALVPLLPDSMGRLRHEPLHAIYGVNCLPVIEGLISAGDVRIQRLFEHLDVRVLEVGWLRNHDQNLESFVNVNTPADLQRVRARIGDDPPSSEGEIRLERDYGKFLSEDGRLNIRLVPRPVYTAMVNEYRKQEHVFREIFETHFWLWDLEEAQRKAQAEGRDLPLDVLAQQVIDGMDDKEWWEIMAAFERHFNDHFADDPARWAEFLDPVYDDQENAGWVRRQ